ncbi:MAG: T9SS type A sorting domain-containing protein [Bacteroidia bacterium]|nr:T9SS type A sorting domain-containing protein [Bacteroidia bacterium]MCF8425291.1 T9SS type A sorting domain-containing protein [Bacteroidia bacterium]MCF8446597.1 T9SS type A sorting domain-containing protein [Bacteroidia bacterium]
MIKTKGFLLGILSLLSCSLWAQEVSVPLNSNPKLANSSNRKVELAQNKKAEGVFPLIDFFVGSGKANPIYWQSNSCSIANRKLIFNALDSNGNVYPSSVFGDEISSNSINTLNASQVFLSFTLSPGNSYKADDSLLVYGLDRFGQWQLLWQSPNAMLGGREVLIELPASQFGSSIFAIKFSAFISNPSTADIDNFGVSQLVLANKLSLPFYNYQRVFTPIDSMVVWDYFAAPDVKVKLGADLGYVYGNVAKLDVHDALDSVYFNANNTYNGTDTFYTHPFNVMAFEEADTILYSFVLRSGTNNTLNDSLIVEFKNNLGQWVRVLALNGIALNKFTNFTFNINSGRNRHANFQSRFVFKSNASKSNEAFYSLSGIRLNKTIALPFFDDFSNSRVRVSTERWLDNFVYVNNDFPVKHPSINVATFDGLDQNGNAYSKFPTKAICDYLTSWPINLSSLQASDSVILSFYYQYEPQGTTNQVFPDDSLIIELRSSAFEKDSFEIIKMIAADDSLLNTFYLFQYVVTDPKFFHSEFQIRIKNRGSQSGNLSHWHVDYIRFNKGRKLNDANKDLALSNTPPIYLGPYTSMPWRQYQANQGAYLHEVDLLRLVNHDNQPYAVDYFRTVLKPEGDTLDKYNNILPTILATSDSTVSIDKGFNFSTTITEADSFIFQTRYRVKISGNQNDNVTGNDTFSVPTIFSNYYAYDDGTAESGYGIQKKTNVGASLKYKLEVPDSIVGVYVFFNQSELDVSTQRFKLKVWKSISPLFDPAINDVVLYSQDVNKPIYTNQINGFTSFLFSNPIAVTDSFYIGWEQTNAFLLNIGLDKNYRFGLNQNMFFKMDGRWYPSEIAGALMIRPIMGRFYGVPTAVNEIQQKEEIQFNLFPNPAHNLVQTDLKNAQNYAVKMIDLSGKEVATLVVSNNQIQLPEVTEGFYILIFENKLTEQKFAKKLIIRH